MGRRITYEELAPIAGMRAKGMSLQEIRGETGFGLATISRFLKKHKEEKPKRQYVRGAKEMVTLQVPEHRSGVFVFFGSPQEVAQMVRELR